MVLDVVVKDMHGLGGVLILQMKGKVPRGRDCFLWT